jgi:hypothetical protein
MALSFRDSSSGDHRSLVTVLRNVPTPYAERPSFGTVAAFGSGSEEYSLYELLKTDTVSVYQPVRLPGDYP